MVMFKMLNLKSVRIMTYIKTYVRLSPEIRRVPPCSGYPFAFSKDDAEILANDAANAAVSGAAIVNSAGCFIDAVIIG